LPASSGADAVELSQGAAGGGDRHGDLLAGRADASVEVTDLGDQVDGHGSQRRLHLVTWPNTSQQLGRNIGTPPQGGAEGRCPVSAVRQYETIESAAAAQRQPRTIRRRIADGSLTGYRIGGGRSIRVESAEVDESLLKPIPAGNAAAS
jgi:hypothetical protein